MDELSVGSLCSGYGGIELGLAAAGWPIRTVWHADKDPDAAAVLATRWPGVPNLGDITTIGRCVCGGPLLGPHDEEWHDEEGEAPGPDDGPQWRDVEPVEVMTAGFPCQPFSVAGRQEGEDDERWLWDDIANAAGGMVARPRMLVLENVPGLLTTNGGHAMARVVHGLAALGYVGRYRVLRAADVGAPHARARVFIVAELADAPRLRCERPAGGTAGVPTPAARDADRGAGWGDQPGRPLSETIHRLLPTPTASRYGNNQSASAGAAVRPSLDSLAKLLPTPTVGDSRNSRNATAQRAAPLSTTATTGWTLADVAFADRWGQYAPAIARWEQVLGRPAPDPTEPGRTGAPRLAPRFVEWMHGLPAGWVTAVPGLSRNAKLRLLGNGVVPLQIAAAVTDLTGTARRTA